MMDTLNLNVPKTLNLNINLSVSGRIEHYHHCDELVSFLTQFRSEVMSAISDFADKMSAHNAKVDAAVDGLVADIGGLKDQIAALQASQGQITAEDQALLDSIEQRAATIASNLEALDALTPPVVPNQ